MKAQSLPTTALVLLLSVGQARAEPLLALIEDNGTFGTVNVATGVFTAVGSGLGGSISIQSIAFTPNGTLYASSFSGLYTINTTTGNASYVSSPSSYFWGLAAQSNSTLLGANETTSNALVSVPTSGASPTTIGNFNPQFNNNYAFGSGAMVYGPGGVLYADQVPSNGSVPTLFSVNPSTAAITKIGTGLGAGGVGLSLAFDGTTLYGIEDGGNDPEIYTINTSTGVATATGVSINLGNEADAVENAVAFFPASVPEPSSFVLIGVVSVLGLCGWQLMRLTRIEENSASA